MNNNVEQVRKIEQSAQEIKVAVYDKKGNLISEGNAAIEKQGNKPDHNKG